MMPDTRTTLTGSEDRLTWRALTIDDAPALTAAYALVEAADRTGEHVSERDVRDILHDHAIDLGRDTLAAFTPDGAVLAFAQLSGPAEIRDVDRVLAEGAVVPAARGRGFGRRLLAWAEERAAVLHRERHPDAPGAVLVPVHERNPSKHALVRAAGYEPVHWEYLMTRGLGEPLPKIASTPPGLTVAPYVRARDEVVRQAHREAFADHWGTTPPDPVRWSQWFTGARAFRPAVSWLALDGDEVAGYLLTYFFAAETAATGVREAYVGQLGVRSAWRRRGVGGLLLTTALASYRAAGYDRAALTVDTHSPTGALGLYERAGFVAKDRWAVWSKPLA